MTSAVLYGTTSDNELRPVQVTDSGEFVTDGGGGGDWYANFYVGGTHHDPTISLFSNGSINAAGVVTSNAGSFVVTPSLPAPGNYNMILGEVDGVEAYHVRGNGDAMFAGNITAVGSVYAANFIPTSGFDINKIGQALSTIYDVIDSVDDLQGLKNLFHLQIERAHV